MTIHRSISSLLNPTRMHQDAADSHYGAFFAPVRSPFEADGDKIVFSEGFRALADKTQVHDRVHATGSFRNRLTHSMEVSRVGRSLGVGVGSRMLNRFALNAPASGDSFWRVDASDIGHIVAAACMAHDMGNPPFGHDGEDAISEFFSKNEIGQKACKMAGAQVGRELCLHEGNAQGFRMITRSMGWRDEGGLNLTMATLAAFGKYPHAIRTGVKKYGVHGADMETMRRVAEATGMTSDGKGGWIRHPLAWLMEAADDICYLTVDLEDATHLGLIDFDELVTLFAPMLNADILNQARKSPNRSGSIKLIRSHIVKSLIESCVEVYPSIADSIESGNLSKDVYGGGFVGHGRYGQVMDAVRRFSKKRIYHSPIVQESRSEFRKAMHGTLEKLSHELIGWLEYRRPGEILTHEETEFKTLARLHCARVGTEIPNDASEAFPWLLDQITLMSDSDILNLAK